jgi:hypothetical protein
MKVDKIEDTSMAVEVVAETVMVSNGLAALLIFGEELGANQPVHVPPEVMPRLPTIQSNSPSTIRGVGASAPELSSTADPQRSRAVCGGAASCLSLPLHVLGNGGGSRGMGQMRQCSRIGLKRMLYARWEDGVATTSRRFWRSPLNLHSARKHRTEDLGPPVSRRAAVTNRRVCLS